MMICLHLGALEKKKKKAPQTDPTLLHLSYISEQPRRTPAIYPSHPGAPAPARLGPPRGLDCGSTVARRPS